MTLNVKRIKTTLFITILIPLALVLIRKLTTLVPLAITEVHTATGIEITVTNWVIQFNILPIMDITTVVSLILACYFTYLWSYRTRTSEKEKEDNGLAPIPNIETS